MEVMSNGKIRRSREEQAALIESFRSSGLSMKRYCEQEGLSASSLRKWLERKESRPRKKSQIAASEQKGFVELTAGKNPSDWNVEVELRNGTVLRLR
jgi:transposase-like protein